MNSKNKKNELTSRQAKYLENLPSARTKQQAALDAGFSPGTARAFKNIDEIIEKKISTEDFAVQLSAKIPYSRIIDKFSELLDARRRIVLESGEFVEVPDNSIQLKCAEIVSRLYNGFGSLESNTNNQVNIQINLHRE